MRHWHETEHLSFKLFLLRLSCRRPTRSDRVTGPGFRNGGASFSGVAGVRRRQVHSSALQGWVRSRCRMLLQLLYVLRIARKSKPTARRRNDDGPKRASHPTSPTMSLLKHDIRSALRRKVAPVGRRFEHRRGRVGIYFIFGELNDKNKLVSADNQSCDA